MPALGGDLPYAMTVGAHIRDTVRLAVPVAVGQLGHVMLGVVDSVMVGKIGTAPLAAAALVNNLFMLLFVTGIGVSLAITPLVAIARGENRPVECGDILRHGIAVNGSFGALFTAVGIGIAVLIPRLGQPAEVVGEAVPYMLLMSALYVPMMVFHGCRQFVEGLGDTRPPMVIVLAGNVANAVLNWVFIYGNLGAPALGLVGSGASTFVTECAMTAAIVVFVRRAERFRPCRPSFSFRRLDRGRIRRLLAIGVPSGVQLLFEVSAFALSAVMIGWTGSASLAAHQIALSLASTTFMVVLGISIATTIRVGNALGRKAHAEVRRAGFVSIGMAVAVMAAFGVGLVVFRHALPALYIRDPATRDIASTLLVIAAAFQILDGTQATSMGALRGLTDVRIPMAISFVAYWMLSLPIGYVLGIAYGHGAPGVWAGYVAGLFTAAALFVRRFHVLTRGIPAVSDPGTTA